MGEFGTRVLVFLLWRLFLSLVVDLGFGLTIYLALIRLLFGRLSLLFPQFNLKCVKVEPPLPANWYCPECVATFGFADSSGPPQKPKQKGRKK